MLQDAVQRSLAARGETLTWDGCRLPEGKHRELRELLSGYAEPLELPGWWSRVEREAEGFAEALISP